MPTWKGGIRGDLAPTYAVNRVCFRGVWWGMKVERKRGKGLGHVYLSKLPPIGSGLFGMLLLLERFQSNWAPRKAGRGLETIGLDTHVSGSTALITASSEHRPPQLIRLGWDK